MRTGGPRRARADLLLLFGAIYFSISFARDCLLKILAVGWLAGRGVYVYEAVKLTGWTLVFFFLLMFAVFLNKRLGGEFLISRRTLAALNIAFAFCALGIMSVFCNHSVDYRYVAVGDGIYFRSFPEGGFNASNSRKMRRSMDLSAEGYRLCPYSRVVGGLKIITAGDSFVYGQMLENKDTLCARVGDAFKKGGTRVARVENLGYPGLNMYSAASVAKDYLNKSSADWVVIGYGAGNAFRFCDAYCQISLARKSFLFKTAVFILGQDFAMQAAQYYSHAHRDDNIAVRKRKAINAVAELAKESNVLVLSYYGDDDFLEEIKNSVSKNLHIVLFNLPQKGNNADSDLVIPNDPHPSAKANLIMAGLVHDYIVSHETNSSVK